MAASGSGGGTPIVLDFGSQSVRCGFAGAEVVAGAAPGDEHQDEPEWAEPDAVPELPRRMLREACVFGIIRHMGANWGMNGVPACAGLDAIRKRAILRNTYPLRHLAICGPTDLHGSAWEPVVRLTSAPLEEEGLVLKGGAGEEDWKAMQCVVENALRRTMRPHRTLSQWPKMRVLDSGFNPVANQLLSADSCEDGLDHSVLITEPFREERDTEVALLRQRESLAEDLLERHQAAGVMFAPREALAAVATMDDLGSLPPRAVVVRFSSTHTRVTRLQDGRCSGPTHTIPIGVEHCRLHLGRLIAARNRNEVMFTSPHGLVGMERDLMDSIIRNPVPNANFEVGDGSVLNVDEADLDRCPEPLFESQVPGAAVMADIIGAIETELGYGDKILLAGPFAHYPGVAERFQAIVRNPDSVVLSPPDASWIGGSRLALHPSFDSRCFTRLQLEEEGAAAMHAQFPFGTFDTALLGGSTVKAARN